MTPSPTPIVVTSPFFGTAVIIFDERGQRVYYVKVSK